MPKTDESQIAAPARPLRCVRWLILGALLALLLAPIPASAASRSKDLVVGLADPLFRDPDPMVRAEWLTRTEQVGVDRVKIFIAWRALIRNEPADARNPADPKYSFAALDAAVRDAAAAGFEILIGTQAAPDWAEGNNRDPDATPGAWKPRPGDVGDYMFALAKRYSGTFPDPLDPGKVLPWVRDFQLWNEPNLSAYFAPQWKGKKLVAAKHYRKLTVKAHAALHEVDSKNRLVAGGTSPYGLDTGGVRSRPLEFWREVFCLKGAKKLKPSGCPAKSKRAHLDVMAHHPINTSGPPRQAANHRDDVSSADLGKITTLLRAAEKKGTLQPKGKRELWATEMWWESNPPDKRQGVSLKKQARYIAESMYLAWEAGASEIVGLRIRDDASNPEQPKLANASGAYFLDGSPKPSVDAYRFPFVTERRNAKKLFFWGRAPGFGKVTIERKDKGGWKRLKRINLKGSRMFTGKVKQKGRAKLRAKLGNDKSLVWKQK